MTARSSSPQKPHARKKADRRVLSPDHLWAARITKRILLDCHPWQRDAVMDPHDLISMVVGRGGAKTTSMRARAMIKMLWLRNQHIGYAALTADHARELNWDKLKVACDQYGIRSMGENPDVTFLDAKMRMICHRTGSIYRLRGVEDKKDAEKFRGFPQAEFGADECGSWNPELLLYTLDQCVEPRLGECLALPPGLLEFLVEWDPNDEDALDEFMEPIDWDMCRGGCMIIGSTPPSVLRGEFYEVTREGSTRHRPYSRRLEPEFEDWLDYSSHYWAMPQVYALPNARNLYPALVFNWEKALKNKKRKGWSDDNPIWKREYLGVWAADDTDTMFKYRPHVDGNPWNRWNPLNWQDATAPRLTTFDETKSIIARLREEFGDIRTVVAADEGFKDPFAVNAYSFSPRDKERRFWHVFAFERTEFYARPFAELLIGEEAARSMSANGRMPDKFGGLFGAIGGWPDGLILDSAETLLADMQNTYGVKFVKADRRPDAKVGGVELVNGDLVDGRIKILKDTPLERQIAVLQWKPDDFGSKKEDKAQANHSTDTLVYGRQIVATMFESGVVVQEVETKTPDVYRDPMGLDPGIGTEVDSDEDDGLRSPSEWSDDDDY